MNTVFMLMKCLVVATYNLILVPLGYNFFSILWPFWEQEKKGKRAKGFEECARGQAPHVLKK